MMRTLKNVVFITCLLICTACSEASVSNSTTSEEEEVVYNPIFADALTAHGELGNYRFTFRDAIYSFQQNHGAFQYTKSFTKDSVAYNDTLTNDSFVRYADGEKLALTEKEESNYSESLNSVIYFTCVPLNLTDPAAKREYLGTSTIWEERFDLMKVTFNAEGGGKDHQDVFYYWINELHHMVDFFAYSYEVNGGGVRFRSAFNSRMVDSMRFQDYVNFSAPVGTPLDSLPALYQRGELEKLSVIELSNISSY